MQACEQILSDKLLDQFAKRAGDYDRENRFFHEDFEDLRDAGSPNKWTPSPHRQGPPSAII